MMLATLLPTWRLLVLTLCSTILLGASAPPPPTPEARPASQALIERAQRAYDRGVQLKLTDADAARESFELAAAGFAEALRLHPNGDLWLNLGNSELQLGRVGAAIHAFRSAEALLGSTSRVQASLSYARSLRQDQIPPRGGQAMVRQIVEARLLLSPSLRLALALAMNALFWGLLCARLFRAVPWAAVAASGVAAALLAVSVMFDVRDWTAADSGVILVDDVTLRTGNGDGFGAAISGRLGSGVELRVLEERPEWLHVELPDGTRGWLRAAQVGRIGGDPGGS